MFGLFKKKAEKKAEPVPQNDQFREWASQFRPEELSILAVTGPSGFSGSQSGDGGPQAVSMELTAWMEEDSPELHQEPIQLTALADQQLWGYLRQRALPDFIIKFRARLALDGRSLLLVNLPEPGFDPDLKAILEEQKKPESIFAENLGTFVLNRQVKWFETEVDWLSGKIRLDFDKGPVSEMKAAQDTARTLMSDQAGWDQRVRAFAADQLLEQAIQWTADGEEDGEVSAELTREDFMSRLELDAVQTDHQGGFTFWFGDGDLFWGHSIRVSGTLSGGPAEAQMEG